LELCNRNLFTAQAVPPDKSKGIIKPPVVGLLNNDRIISEPAPNAIPVIIDPIRPEPLVCGVACVFCGGAVLVALVVLALDELDLDDELLLPPPLGIFNYYINKFYCIKYKFKKAFHISQTLGHSRPTNMNN
jgi:hypothetical protein